MIMNIGYLCCPTWCLVVYRKPTWKVNELIWCDFQVRDKQKQRQPTGSNSTWLNHKLCDGKFRNWKHIYERPRDNYLNLSTFKISFHSHFSAFSRLYMNTMIALSDRVREMPVGLDWWVSVSVYVVTFS